MVQCISIIDSYGYWPMVRQVFSHRVFRPLENEIGDEQQIRVGMDAPARVLPALEYLVLGTPHLVSETPSLADIHLAPMMAYFTAAPEGACLLARYPLLSNWWSHWQKRDSVLATDPKLFSPDISLVGPEI